MLYVNPGYIELMDGSVSGKTVLNNNGPAFYNTLNGYNLNITGYKELWVKLKFVYVGKIIRIYTQIDRTTGVIVSSSTEYHLWHNDSDLSGGFQCGELVAGNEYEILLHTKSDSTNGIAEFYINGVLNNSYFGAMDVGAFPGIEIQSDSNTFFRDLIIADFDITDYHIAQCDVKSYETNFEKQSDGSLKAATAGEYLSSIIDTAALETEMKKNVTSAEIVGVNVSAFNVSYDSNVINALKSSIDGTDSEDLTITNNNVAGKVLTVNPALNKAWTLAQLKTASFKLTAEKV